MNTDELTLTRFFYAVAYYPEWALDDPEFPVLQSLRPLMTNALEHLAYEYPQGNGLVDHGDGELPAAPIHPSPLVTGAGPGHDFCATGRGHDVLRAWGGVCGSVG